MLWSARWARTFAIAGLFVSGLDVAGAQAPAFDVASVKPNRSGVVSMSIGPLVGRDFSAENVPLRELIRYAYQQPDFQLVNVPAWAASERFDVRARTGDVSPSISAGEAPDRLMLRALLADRFKLAIHAETREVPTYALVRSRRDGQPGPARRATETDCAALKEASRGAPPVVNDGLRCGFRNNGTGLFVANALDMSAFARFLSGQVQRVVFDRTGLKGEWDFRLTWTPARLQDAGAQSDGPSLFTALQEQLGLKLDSTKGPVDVLVIDGVERPTPD